MTILNKLGCYKVILTNPSFYTRLEMNDKIIMIGTNYSGHRKSNLLNKNIEE